MIQFGSIEYFELLSFHDKLKSYRLDKLDLLNLDRLRTEVAMKIEAINEVEKERRINSPNNSSVVSKET